MKTIKALATAAIAAAILPLSAGIAKAVNISTIDPLTDLQIVDETGSGATTIVSPLLGTVTRTVTVNTVRDPSNSAFPLNAEAAIAGGQLAFSTGVDNDAIVTLDYGTFAPANLTAGGAESVNLGLDTADLAGTTITVTINGISVTAGPLGTAPPAFDELFAFSSFSGLDPTSVTSFTIAVDPVTEGDVTVSFIGTAGPGITPGTPEPTTLLGLLAVAGFGATALKKKQG